MVGLPISYGANNSRVPTEVSWGGLTAPILGSRSGIVLEIVGELLEGGG